MPYRSKAPDREAPKPGWLEPSEECDRCTPAPIGVFIEGELVRVLRHHFCGRGNYPGDLHNYRRAAYRGRTVHF